MKLRDLLVTRETKTTNSVYLDYESRKQQVRDLVDEAKEKVKCTTEKEVKKSKSKKSECECVECAKFRVTEKLLKAEISALETEKKRLLKDEQSETNKNVEEWELAVPKDIRAGAVQEACTAFKSAQSNFRKGNIRSFNVHYKKKLDARSKCISLSKQSISIRDSKISICTQKYNGAMDLRVSPRNARLLKATLAKIDHDCKLVYLHRKWTLFVPVPTSETPVTRTGSFCGGDLGVRKFLTTLSYSRTEDTASAVLYTHRRDLLRAYNDKLTAIKHASKTRCQWRPVRKKQLVKLEQRKKHLVDELHWSVINDLLARHDTLYIGDIKSHDIVGRSKNHSLNQEFSDLRFYTFKQRLQFKAKLAGRSVVFPNEAYTTQGCSMCGNLWSLVGSNELYTCKKCNAVFDRDINSAKNILMKGIIGTSCPE
jgi:IS605 OrfB family transposase